MKESIICMIMKRLAIYNFFTLVIYQYQMVNKVHWCLESIFTYFKLVFDYYYFFDYFLRKMIQLL